MRRFSGFEIRILLVLGSVLLPLPLFARCPIAPAGTLVVRAAGGNLNVDTTGVDAVDVDVSDKAVHVQETCGGQTVTLEGSDPKGAVTPVWKIRVPKSVNLDLVASAGGITIAGDSDGSVVLRTGGGSVTVGNIKGQTTIYTAAGAIKAGNIGSGAELRSEGDLNVGNVAGNAVFRTQHGTISAGMMGGNVKAETAGGKVSISDARGDVNVPNTRGGDITIGNANRILAQTEGGSIRIRRGKGPFQGHTDQGDIRIDQAASWVEASTDQGDIELHMVPDNPDGDLHINLQTGIGSILLYLPEKYRAAIDAIVDRPSFRGQSIIADFASAKGPAAAAALAPISRSGIGATRGALAPFNESYQRNVGGNPGKLHASLGTIEIRLSLK